MKNDFWENWNLPEPDHLPDPDQFINRLHDARLEANIRKDTSVFPPSRHLRYY